jgi:hypothetical protein
VLPRRIKPGSVLVREWKGESHRVMVLADGFAYDGETYSNLSEIAVLITGTRWNGPRFFGLRSKTQESDERAGLGRSDSAKRSAEAASARSGHQGGGSDCRKRKATDRRSLRSAGKDGGWCPTRPRLLVAIRGCRQTLRWCLGSCQSMPLRPRPKPRHHPANRWARRLNERLGGFGMCNAPCWNYRIPARKCRHGARHYPGSICVVLADHRDRATGRPCGGLIVAGF